jgi:hypothetical protein
VALPRSKVILRNTLTLQVLVRNKSKTISKGQVTAAPRLLKSPPTRHAIGSRSLLPSRYSLPTKRLQNPSGMRPLRLWHRRENVLKAKSKIANPRLKKP